MTNKATYSTVKKLWFFNHCTVVAVLILQLNITIGTETKVETSQNVTLMENNTTLQQPVAEPLIRLRRQPPITIVKRIIRPKRIKIKRVKRPKVKYSFAEPPRTYYSSKPINVKRPTFDSSMFEGFSHLNVESGDFRLPPSSYEAQSMDLDLYKHHEPSVEVSYKDRKKPLSYFHQAPKASFKETIYSEVYKPPPSASYTSPEVDFKEPSRPTTYSFVPSKNLLHTPHTTYGVPAEFFDSTSYEKPHDDMKYSHETPLSELIYTEIQKPSSYSAHGKNEYSYKTPHIPATDYGVPDVNIPLTNSKDYNKYSVIKQKRPYEPYTPAKTEAYNFAEPPPQLEPNIEITYSPSYEINIPSKHESGKYNSEHQHIPPSPTTSYEGNFYQESSEYEKPTQQYYPSQNYHPSNNYTISAQHNNDYSLSSYQEDLDTNQPASYYPAPTRQDAITEHIPYSEDLPLNVNHKQSPYDYPKSSYEVPIYDPIPFDSSNYQEREIYPPQKK